MLNFSLGILFIFILFPCIFSQKEECKGKSDVIFVIDHSGSINDTEWTVFMKSCLSIVNEFDNIVPGGVHVGIVEFGSGYYRDVHLTGNKNEVVSHFNKRMEGCETPTGCTNKRIGCTFISHALEGTYKEIQEYGREGVMKIIFFFTDGAPFYSNPGDFDCLNDYNVSCCEFSGIKGNCERESNDCIYGSIVDYHSRRLKEDFNSWIVPIRITTEGNYDMMIKMATYDCLYFRIDKFEKSYFDPLVSVFKHLTCLDVYSVEPNYYCLQKDSQMMQFNGEIKGNGFLNSIPKHPSCDLGNEKCFDVCSDLQMKCRTKELKTGTITVSNAIVKDSETLDCQINVPSQQKQEVIVEVSLDGTSFTDSNSTLEIVDCSPFVIEPLDPDACSCRGLTDIIFVLDSSYSVDDLEFAELKKFVENLVSSICIDEEFAHVSIIQFTTTIESYHQVEFNLTGDRNHVLRSARNLGRFGKGGTPLHSGLKAAYNQIIQFGREDAYKFVIVVSDGVTDSCKGINVDSFGGSECPDPSIEKIHCQSQYQQCSGTNRTCYWDIGVDKCCNCDQDWISKIESTGAFLYGVTVGEGEGNDDLDVKYVKEMISSKPEYYSHSTSFTEINQKNFIGKLINSTCIDVFFASPSSLCYGEEIETIIVGTGFTNDTIAIIRFYQNNKILSEFNIAYKSKNQMKLVIDVNETTVKTIFPSPGIYEFSVSIGGKFWSSRKPFTYTLDAKYCKTSIDIIPIVSGFTLGILVFLCCLSLLFLLGLLFLGIRRSPKRVRKVELREEELEDIDPLPSPPEEKEPEPESYIPPPNIKRSMYYVNGKAMSIDWGEKGMTWDSPFRGNNMGMGDSFGHTKKNKLYEEIQRRKRERAKRQAIETQKKQYVSGEVIHPKPKVNRSLKPKAKFKTTIKSKPKVNKELKPKVNHGLRPTVNRASRPKLKKGKLKKRVDVVKSFPKGGVSDESVKPSKTKKAHTMKRVMKERKKKSKPKRVINMI